MDSDEATGEAASVKGRVGKISRQLQAVGDEGLAYQLQNEEFVKKRSFNQSVRQVARIDVPLAKQEQLTEEERMQREQLEFLERQKSITDEDKRIALELQKEEEERGKRAAVRTIDTDAEMARRFQNEELRLKERQEMLRQMKDEELARRLQEQESRLAQARRSEREVREQRLILQRELLDDMEEDEQAPALPMKNRDAVERRQRTETHERRVPGSSIRNTAAIFNQLGDYLDTRSDDMSEIERQQLFRMQDEEVAKALQDYEKRKAKKKSSSSAERRDIRKELEERDAQLARILQEQERLEMQKEDEIRKIEEQISRSQMLQEGDVYSVYPVPHVESRPQRSPVSPSGASRDEDSRLVRSPPTPSGMSLNRSSNNVAPVYSVVSKNPARPVQSLDESSSGSMASGSATAYSMVSRTHSQPVEDSRAIHSRDQIHSNSDSGSTQIYQIPPAPRTISETDDPSTIYQNSGEAEKKAAGGAITRPNRNTDKNRTSCKQQFG